MGLALACAIGGGWIAAALAVLLGISLGMSGWVLLFLVGPLYEEALKPLGVYFVMLLRPNVEFGRLTVGLLSAVGGLTFGLLESWLYIESHQPDEGYVLFRFTAPLVMHVAASFVMGLGINRALLGWVARRNPLPKKARDAYFTALVIHFAYNVTVVVLAAAGSRPVYEA